MTSYLIAELENPQSMRAPQRAEAKNLSDAKRKATRMQMFQGTVMEICNQHGAVLAVKQDGVWTNAD